MSLLALLQQRLSVFFGLFARAFWCVVINGNGLDRAVHGFDELEDNSLGSWFVSLVRSGPPGLDRRWRCDLKTPFRPRAAIGGVLNSVLFLLVV